MQLRNRFALWSAFTAFGIVALLIWTFFTLIQSEARTNRTVQAATPPVSSLPEPSTLPKASGTEAPIPPITNGYTVFAYDTDGSYINYTSVQSDRIQEEEATGKTRDPLDFKASILNAACVCTADGNGLKEEDKDPKFQKFCEGKSLNWCISTRSTERNLDTYHDYFEIDEYCKPRNRQQAERHVTLVTSRDEIPSTSDECRLYCACEGNASRLPKDDDPERGPCTNRVNCQLVCPISYAASALAPPNSP